MKKVFYIFSLISLFMLPLGLKAQVGVLTEDPKTTFHVQSSNNSNVPDGIKPPVLTKQQLATKASGVYGTNQTGTIVYVNDVTGGTSGASVAQVVDVKKKGNYRFDGVKWVSMETPSSSEYTLYNIVRVTQPSEVNFTNIPPASGYDFLNNAYYNLNMPISSLVIPANSQVLCVSSVSYNIAYSIAMMNVAQSRELLNNLLVGININIVDQNGTALAARFEPDAFQTSKFSPKTNGGYIKSTITTTYSNNGDLLITNNTAQDINASILVTGYHAMFTDYYANFNYNNTVVVLICYKKDL